MSQNQNGISSGFSSGFSSQFFFQLNRASQPIDDEGMVHFTTTLFALIRENLSIKMRAAEEMDQADLELRTTIIKVWPYEGKDKIDLIVPPREGTYRFTDLPPLIYSTIWCSLRIGTFIYNCVPWPPKKP